MSGTVAVNPEIDLGEDLAPLAIGGAPIQKECALVKLSRRRGCIRQSQAGRFSAALPLLNLPAGNIHIDQKVPLSQQQRCAAANGDHAAFFTVRGAASLVNFRGIEVFIELNRRHACKDRVVAEDLGELRLNRQTGKHCLGALQHQCRRKPSHQLPPQRFKQHAGITLDRDAPRVALRMNAIEDLAPADGAVAVCLRDRHGGVFVEARWLGQRLDSMSGIAPRSAASEPSAAGRNGTVRPGVQACAFTYSCSTGKILPARFITDPPKTTTSGS